MDKLTSGYNFQEAGRSKRRKNIRMVPNRLAALKHRHKMGVFHQEATPFSCKEKDIQAMLCKIGAQICSPIFMNL